MSKTIILFLSKANENAREYPYECPDGGVVPGTNSCDAPIRWLLQTHEDVGRILTIRTPEAEESSWPAFQALVRGLRPDLEPVPIDFREGEDFSGAPLARILAELGEKDEILLETTGGFRNAVMHLLLLSRVLAYRGNPTVQAVYGNFFAEPKRLEDVSPLFEIFSLSEGLHTLTDFGNTGALRAYYDRLEDPDPAVRELIDAMEALSEAIALCRTRLLEDRMARFRDALDRAASCSDPLMRHLLPVFREAFREKLNTPGLILWCVRNGMLQQALTIYTERVPAYIKRTGEVLAFPPCPDWVRLLAYEDESAAQFMRHFLTLSRSSWSAVPVKVLRDYLRENAGRLAVWEAEDAEPEAPVEMKAALNNMFLAARLAFPEEGEGYRRDWTRSLPEGQGGLQEVANCIGLEPPADRAKMIGRAQTFKAEALRGLLEAREEDDLQYGVKNALRFRIWTIEHLEECLPGSGYEPKVPVEQLQAIARDYLYIKALRNMTNHAGGEETAEQELLMEYLAPFGYRPLEEIAAAEVGEVLRESLGRLRRTGKTKKKRK